MEAHTLPDTPSPSITVEGLTRRGRPCHLTDKTATLSPETLESLLQDLIDQEQFGVLGVTQGDTLSLGAPRFSHIQLEGRLYRLLVFRHHATIEEF